MSVLLTIYIALAAAVLASIAACVLQRTPAAAKLISFMLLAVSGAAAVYAGVTELMTIATATATTPTETTSFLIAQFTIANLPQLACQLRFDALSAFFFTIVGIIVFSCAVYGYGYMRGYERQRPIASLTFFTGIFITGMYLVLLASDVFSFMLAWELMSISSYFLVAYHHEHAANRRAAFIYLIMAHLSGLLILLSYGVLLQFGNADSNGSASPLSFTFAAISSAITAVHSALAVSASPSPWALNAAFLLALCGFGMKAGIVPLHVWLPRAHPVAPSHISALMSGVMLKVAVYGFLRFCFSLLHIDSWCWQWGALLLGMGALSALVGILYALMQTDLKKLLAYSSVENIGIIFAGIGLSMIFFSSNHPMLGTLGCIAVFYHCLNHALFKSLLFLGAGAVLQRTHEHDLERMGGLIHRMPQTALFFLIGCLSIAALPPLNGFVSEWLMLQTALHATISDTLLSSTWSSNGEILRVMIMLAAALLALTGALAATCFVKVYGVAFLGQARTRRVRHASDPHLFMRLALGLLALLCVAAGLFPPLIIKVLRSVIYQLIGASNGETLFSGTNNWLWLMPLNSAPHFVYSPPWIAGGIIIGCSLCYGMLRLCYGRGRLVRVKPWECGFGGITSRMQYSATAFAMLLRRVFSGVWPVTEKIEKFAAVENATNSENLNCDSNCSLNSDARIKHVPASIAYTLHIGDGIWKYCYAPLERYIAVIARHLAVIQSGNIRIYLGYAFITIILLLWLIV